MSQCGRYIFSDEHTFWICLILPIPICERSKAVREWRLQGSDGQMLSKPTFLWGACFVATNVTMHVAFAQAPGQPSKSTATPPVAVGEATNSDAPAVPQRRVIRQAIRVNVANRDGKDHGQEARPQLKPAAELEYFDSETPPVKTAAKKDGPAKEPAQASAQTATGGSTKYYHLDDESVQTITAPSNSKSVTIPNEDGTTAPPAVPAPVPSVVRKVVEIGGDVLQTQAVASSPVQIQFDDNELPEVGTVLQAFHKYPLGWEPIGKLVVTGHSGRQVIAQPQTATTIRLRAGDRVETRITKSFRQ